jgi:hypothetical protein
MSLRNRGGIWHYRFRLDGREYAETTGLAATKQNERDARQMEAEHLQALAARGASGGFSARLTT